MIPCSAVVGVSIRESHFPYPRTTGCISITHLVLVSLGDTDDQVVHPSQSGDCDSNSCMAPWRAWPSSAFRHRVAPPRILGVLFLLANRLSKAAVHAFLVVLASWSSGLPGPGIHHPRLVGDDLRVEIGISMMIAGCELTEERRRLTVGMSEAKAATRRHEYFMIVEEKRLECIGEGLLDE